MDKKYKKIWQLALPYLEKGKRKDFVTHTKGVIKAMEMILKKEKGDKDLLIPAAILHDVGWAKVPVKIKKSGKKMDKDEALRLHIKYAPEIIKGVLDKVDWSKEQINEIIEIVIAHKFVNPRKKVKQLLIDADNLSDALKEQFYSDAKSYKNNAYDFYKIRLENKFYTKTAKKIFDIELEKRRKEIFDKKKYV
jgi:HD superfamily phosphodiesterase